MQGIDALNICGNTSQLPSFSKLGAAQDPISFSLTTSRYTYPLYRAYSVRLLTTTKENIQQDCSVTGPATCFSSDAAHALYRVPAHVSISWGSSKAGALAVAAFNKYCPLNGKPKPSLIDIIPLFIGVGPGVAASSMQVTSILAIDPFVTGTLTTAVSFDTQDWSSLVFHKWQQRAVLPVF